MYLIRSYKHNEACIQWYSACEQSSYVTRAEYADLLNTSLSFPKYFIISTVIIIVNMDNLCTVVVCYVT